VVTAQQEKVLLKFDLVREQKNNRLEGLLAAVHVVAQEEVVGLRRVASILEKPQQVSELAVHVAYTRLNEHV
jgi:hypothetical protein